MSFKDTNTAKSHLGNVVRFTPNTKGTGTRGVASAVQLMSRDFTLSADVNPDGQPSRYGADKNDFDSSDKGSAKRSAYRPVDVSANRSNKPATVNPDSAAEQSGARATRRVAAKRAIV